MLPQHHQKRDELASLHVPSARDHALYNGSSLALCDQAASEKWHTTDLPSVGSMSALGHKRTFAVQNVMSALPPKADMCSATRRCPLCANSGHQPSFTF